MLDEVFARWNSDHELSKLELQVTQKLSEDIALHLREKLVASRVVLHELRLNSLILVHHPLLDEVELGLTHLNSGVDRVDVSDSSGHEALVICVLLGHHVLIVVEDVVERDGPSVLAEIEEVLHIFRFLFFSDGFTEA